MTLLNTQKTTLTWIGACPSENEKIAVLIPQYNEASNFDLEARLSYFKEIADSFSDKIDVILIDDGSTDSSLMQIRDFLERNDHPFYLAAVFPNANKVGALSLVANTISHEFVILSDFDTDIKGYDIILNKLNAIQTDTSCMGFYFRLLPFEGRGEIFNFQRIEYAMLRSLYKFYAKDSSVPVMPGAGACYKRSCLLSIYDDHSGLRSGEDREATMIGLKQGHRTFYEEKILCLTRPPLSFNVLLKQRIRWNLGYLETYHKEYKYYAQEVRRWSRIGVVFLLDILTVSFLLFLPLLVLILGIYNLHAALVFLLSAYSVGVASCLAAFFLSPGEFSEIKNKIVPTALLFPVIKFTIGNLSWAKAFYIFFKTAKQRASPVRGSQRWIGQRMTNV